MIEGSPWLRFALLCLMLLASREVARALDGYPDPSGGSGSIGFDLGGDHFDFATACVAESDGGMLLAGRAKEEDGTGFKIALARLQPNGLLDPNFGVGGRLVFKPGQIAFYDDPQLLAIAREPQGGGYIVAGGILELGNRIGFFARVTAAGNYDSSFDLHAQIALRSVTAVAIDPANGVIWLAGPQSDLNDGVWVVEKHDASGNSLGSLAFTLPGAPVGGPLAIALQPDGKPVVIGQARSAAATYTSAAIARLTTAVQLDAGFGFNGGRFQIDYGVSTVARSVAVRPDGRILLSGEIGDPVGYNYVFVTQLRSDGMLSTDWGFGSGNTVFVEWSLGGASGDGATGSSRMGLATDGTVLVAAQSTTGNAENIADIGIARFLPNGELDPAFHDDGRASWDLPPFGDGAGNDWPTCVTTSAGKPVVAGAGEWDGSDWDFGLLRLDNRHIFSDSFESGGAFAWQAPS